MLEGGAGRGYGFAEPVGISEPDEAGREYGPIDPVDKAEVDLERPSGLTEPVALDIGVAVETPGFEFPVHDAQYVEVDSEIFVEIYVDVSTAVVSNVDMAVEEAVEDGVVVGDVTGRGSTNIAPGITPVPAGIGMMPTPRFLFLVEAAGSGAA